jgi:hypothetical protein
MSPSIDVNRKRRRGRPYTTGGGTLVGVRVEDEQLADVDRFRLAQLEPLSRPEALRLLAEIGFDSLERVATANPSSKSRKKR